MGTTVWKSHVCVGELILAPFLTPLTSLYYVQFAKFRFDRY